MRYLNNTILLVLLAVIALSGCAGEGYNLNGDGNPVGTVMQEMPLDFAPTFANIQHEVINRRCVNCHYGASAAVGLQLDAANSYSMLLGRRSNQQSEYLLVKPGYPDESYLIRKLEGRPNITGSQMPSYGPPLSQATINSIRAWITAGAPQ